MVEQDTVKLLRECDAGVKMGIKSIDDVLGHVKSDSLEKYLTDCKDEHEKLGEEENIYTVVAADIGEFDNIHPIDKKPVGERLALAALANEYGKDVKWQSPKLASVYQKDGKYIFAFDNAELLTYKGDKPEGFFITLKSGEIIPCDAEINGATIEVKENPDASAIGYCDINYCIANIYNEAGLPLFPFHQDL